MSEQIQGFEALQTRIEELKKEKNAVIMAHYYVPAEVQDIADYIGDSYFLSDKATKIDADVIVLCGVEFMGESAKILNPDKTVLLPAPDADCPMAHMAQVDRILEVREQYDDVAVVCYVNSTAELKANSDVCVTSANAEKIVTALPNKNIFFIPDQNLAKYIATKLPEKNFIFNDGYCPIHHVLQPEQIAEAKNQHPEAKVCVHPESQPAVVDMADYIGSTSGIIKYVSGSDAEEFIIVTEMGVLHEIQKRNPDKKLYLVSNQQVCVDMKKITLERIVNALETGEGAVEMEETFMQKALAPMERMLELSK